MCVLCCCCCAHVQLCNCQSRVLHGSVCVPIDCSPLLLLAAFIAACPRRGAQTPQSCHLKSNPDLSLTEYYHHLALTHCQHTKHTHQHTQTDTHTPTGASLPIAVKLADAKPQDMQRVGAKRGMTMDAMMGAGGPNKRQMMGGYGGMVREETGARGGQGGAQVCSCVGGGVVCGGMVRPGWLW